MSSKTQKFKLLKTEKDASFNIDNLERYTLFLQFGPNDLQVGVINSDDKKLLLIEDYILPGVSDTSERLESYEQIFQEHHLLMANFWKEVKVSIKTRKFTLVPERLYNDSRTGVFLAMNTNYNKDNETLQVSSLDGLGIKVIYAIESQVLHRINSIYPRAGFKTYPHCSSFILGAREFLKDKKGNFNCLCIDRFVLHQAVFKNGHFQFYNLFPIREFEDYFRYISMVNADFGLDPVQDKIVIWGFIGSGSDQYAELKSKYAGLELGRRPTGLKFSHAFDEFEDHQYFELFNSYLL